MVEIDYIKLDELRRTALSRGDFRVYRDLSSVIGIPLEFPEEAFEPDYEPPSYGPVPKGEKTPAVRNIDYTLVAGIAFEFFEQGFTERDVGKRLSRLRDVGYQVPNLRGLRRKSKYWMLMQIRRDLESNAEAYGIVKEVRELKTILARRMAAKGT